MKRAILWFGAAIAVGCTGGGHGPVGDHQQTIIESATLEDVRELGIDEAGCEEAVEAGGEPIPVEGRPDLIGLALDGVVICVTTLDAVVGGGLDMSWLKELGRSNSPDAEPEPETYDQEPEPETYRGSEGDASDK